VAIYTCCIDRQPFGNLHISTSVTAVAHMPHYHITIKAIEIE
jgi:hypothetical protein